MYSVCCVQDEFLTVHCFFDNKAAGNPHPNLSYKVMLFDLVVTEHTVRGSEIEKKTP